MLPRTTRAPGGAQSRFAERATRAVRVAARATFAAWFSAWRRRVIRRGDGRTRPIFWASAGSTHHSASVAARDALRSGRVRWCGNDTGRDHDLALRRTPSGSLALDSVLRGSSRVSTPVVACCASEAFAYARSQDRRRWVGAVRLLGGLAGQANDGSRRTRGVALRGGGAKPGYRALRRRTRRLLRTQQRLDWHQRPAHDPLLDPVEAALAVASVGTPVASDSASPHPAWYAAGGDSSLTCRWSVSSPGRAADPCRAGS